jgi:site-specific recombinase XerD
MSVYRHKGSQYYHFDFQMRGTRFSGSTATDNEHDARAFEEAEKVRAKDLFELMDAEQRAPMTVARALTRWWDEHGQHLSDTNIKSAIDWQIAHFGTKKLLHEVTDDDVSKMVADRRQDTRRSGRDDKGKQLYRPISARTVNNTTISLLCRVLRRARDNWNAVIIREPVWKKHKLKETKRPIREITIAEEQRLDEEESAEFRELREFAVITGLRRRAVLLTWPQVDFAEALVRYIGKGGVPKVLPLTRRAYALLWALRGNHPIHVFTFVAQRTRPCPKTRDPKTGEAFVFVKGQRYPITYYGMGSNKRKWAKAGVDARIHDMRHTTGTRTMRRTGNLKALQIQLGHSDIAITAKFYADVPIEDLRDVMEETATKQTAAKSRSFPRSEPTQSGKPLK